MCVIFLSKASATAVEDVIAFFSAREEREPIVVPSSCWRIQHCEQDRLSLKSMLCYLVVHIVEQARINLN
ncbi:hypothetical protein AVEN_31333-1, partial [Araneus ventricosus]